ncbi:MAG: flagellar assembly protein FliW [Nitrospiraceae bacterium]|nr:flagellar assembly protein FliW [Nitrospiraceae bacterium]
MKIKFGTSRFGNIEVEEDRIINFPEGLLGFSSLKRYILMDYKDTPLKWLQAVDDPDVAFIVTGPSVISPGFSFRPDESTRQMLEIERDEDVAILVIVRVDSGKVIANFNGPLILNAGNMKGVQVVLEKVF